MSSSSTSSRPRSARTRSSPRSGLRSTRGGEPITRSSCGWPTSGRSSRSRSRSRPTAGRSARRGSGSPTWARRHSGRRRPRLPSRAPRPPRTAYGLRPTRQPTARTRPATSTATPTTASTSRPCSPVAPCSRRQGRSLDPPSPDHPQETSLVELTHEFTVPVPVQEAWDHFQDIASVAECFPGAQVTDTEGETFHGSVKVKLGPIALVYNGSGTFTEKDEVAHRFVVDAKGKDKRGNGTAGAKVTLSMDGTADSTDVKVLTAPATPANPARFGRGVMKDASDRLLGKSVPCLEQRLGEEGQPAAPAAAAEPA